METPPRLTRKESLAVLLFLAAMLCAFAAVWVADIVRKFDLYRNGEIVSCTVSKQHIIADKDYLYDDKGTRVVHSLQFDYDLSCGGDRVFIAAGGRHREGAAAKVYRSTVNPANAEFHNDSHPYSPAGVIFSGNIILSLFVLLLALMTGAAARDLIWPDLVKRR